MTDLEKRLDELEKNVAVTHAMLKEALVSGRNSVGMYNRMANFEDVLNKINKTWSRLDRNLAMLNTDKRFIELFTDDDLKIWYMQTDLTVKDVHEHLKKSFPDTADMSTQQISNYIHGITKDLLIRSFLGRLFRDKAIEKAK